MNHNRRITQESVRELSQIKTARVPEPTSRFNPKTPLKNEVPFGPTTQKELNDDMEMRDETEINRSISEENNEPFKVIIKKPTQRDRVRIIKAKLIKLRMAGLSERIRAKQHDEYRSDDVEDVDEKGHIITPERYKSPEWFKKYNPKTVILDRKQQKTSKIDPGAFDQIPLDTRYKASTIMDESGDLYKSKFPGDTHYTMARRSGYKSPIPYKSHGEEYVTDDDVHRFIRDNNLIRVQHFPDIQKISLHIPKQLTPGQIKSIREFEKIEPNISIGYVIGKNFKSMEFGEGVRNLLFTNAKMFGIKQGQEEDDNVNLTYMDSKKIKKYRELFPDQRHANSHPSIDLFKKQRLPSNYKEGYVFDPRHKQFLSPELSRKYYGKPGLDLHFVATTDNPGGPEELTKALEDIGEQHFIGGWESPTGFKTDASYIFNTNDKDEVQRNLEKHNQEATFTVHPDNTTELIYNLKHKPRT